MKFQVCIYRHIFITLLALALTGCGMGAAEGDGGEPASGGGSETVTEETALGNDAADGTVTGETASDKNGVVPAMVPVEDMAGEADSSYGDDTDEGQTEPSAVDAAGEGGESTDGGVHLLDSISDIPAGEIIEAESLDLSDPDRYFTSSVITPGDGVYERIYGYSYVDNEHISLDDLRYLKVLHYNYDGKIQTGEIIVNKRIEDKMLDIFRELFDEKYQIYQMKLVEEFWTIDSEQTDETSIKNDNTSCFNYRVVVGEKSISKHAYGVAIDINPYENPFSRYNKDGSFNVENLDEHERACLYDRSLEHCITEDDAAYKAFTSRGFKWGGHWKTLKDYQHFQYDLK